MFALIVVFMTAGLSSTMMRKDSMGFFHGIFCAPNLLPGDIIEY